MNRNAALEWADALIYERTGAHLSELQTTILRSVFQGQRYLEIAVEYGCTEGHAKDTGAELWKHLSEALGEKVTKANFKSVFDRHWHPSQRRSLEPNILTPQNGSPQASFPNFVGREAAIAHLNHLIERGKNTIVIQGEGGIGKTTLAQQFLRVQDFDRVLEWLMAKETETLTPVEGVVEEWLRRDFQEEPGREFGVTLARLKRHLQTQRIGILIDNLEPALNREGRMIETRRNYLELLRVLSDPLNRSVTLITSRDRLCESGISVEHYRLPGLSLDAWRHFWNRHHIGVTDGILRDIHCIYGGNAKAMEVLSGIIGEDFDGDMVAYWEENRHTPLQPTALRNLVTSQMTRLQELDRDAYQLLCRLGCYRFQEKATIPKAAVVALLWDVADSEHPQVIQSLRNRSLLEFQGGRYWLHPVIRAEAIARLRQGPDWEQASRRAAQYWTESVSTIVTLDDALSAWEAYHHAMEIKDFAAASQVILQSRHNQWQQFLPLGSLLYRMGLIQPVVAAIHQILDHVTSKAQSSELNNLLGDLYWTVGKIHAAIAAQEQSLDIARHCLEDVPASVPDQIEHQAHRRYYLRMLEIDSLLSLGLYNIDLWELEAAQQQLGQVISLSHETAHHRWAEKASVCLALVNSYLGEHDQSKALAETLYPLILAKENQLYMGRFAYFIQLLAQAYTNLGDLSKAKTLFDMAIAYSQDSHYPQVQANCLTGLGEVNRRLGKPELARSQQNQAIQLLEDIGAQCDLARAYCQSGITHWQGEADTAAQHFSRAIQIFHQIEAHRQVERVKTIEMRLKSKYP